MDGFSVKMVGLKELDAKLTELGTTAAARIVREGLKAGGEVMWAAVQERTPVRPVLPSGTALPPGALALDIELHIGRDEDGFPAAIVGPGKYTAFAARWVEYGHKLVRGGQLPWFGFDKSGRARRRGGRGYVVGEVPAHPFIRPGYEASAQDAVRIAVETITAGVEAAAKK